MRKPDHRFPSAAEPQPNYGTIRACPLIGTHFTLPRVRPCSPWLLLAAQERTTGNTGGHGENQQGELPRVEVSATYRQLKSTRYAKKQNVSSTNTHESEKTSVRKREAGR